MVNRTLNRLNKVNNFSGTPGHYSQPYLFVSEQFLNQGLYSRFGFEEKCLVGKALDLNSGPLDRPMFWVCRPSAGRTWPRAAALGLYFFIHWRNRVTEALILNEVVLFFTTAQCVCVRYLICICHRKLSQTKLETGKLRVLFPNSLANDRINSKSSRFGINKINRRRCAALHAQSMRTQTRNWSLGTKVYFWLRGLLQASPTGMSGFSAGIHPLQRKEARGRTPEDVRRGCQGRQLCSCFEWRGRLILYYKTGNGVHYGPECKMHMMFGIKTRTSK